MSTTIKMIAHKLSLSVATVSKALADSHEISKETKLLVSNAAQEMGYVRNPYASSLRKGRSKTIAIVIPEIADSFFAEAINGIEEVALLQGYHVLIYLTHESLLREQAILQDFRSGRVDGILMSVSEETNDTEHIKTLMESQVPVVFFDRVCEELNTTCVVTDDFESSFIATNHLISKGCSKIAFMGNSINLAINRNRVNGYIEALKQNGLSDYQNVVICGKDKEISQQIFADLLSGPERPDGMILSVEKLSAMLYQICEDMMIDIPSQLKVLTFTNFNMAQFLSPSLTTVKQPAFQMGKVAATALLRKLSFNNTLAEPETVILPSVITFRKSTS
ncbi:LacI family DNA-binding transcriptional regulator [Mucilaginibacter galii]|uniref:LacI family transcriptional regulator n=1 Tax=Mucilaginibacter galii TaxID=2005073 RepID=A0A917J8N0_9SPHI|nr:LacI family DNA-binding transcriptional regulator [Mucilaginibacter galii]GGI50157.1 LacI family transcriptional regulator [Mucilaginibacter galii]